MSLILVISQFQMDHNFTLIVLFPLSFTGFNRLLTTHIGVPSISVIPLDRVPREPGLPEGLIFLRSYHILPYALARRRSAELPVSMLILLTGFLAKLPPQGHHHVGLLPLDHLHWWRRWLRRVVGFALSSSSLLVVSGGSFDARGAAQVERLWHSSMHPGAFGLMSNPFALIE